MSSLQQSSPDERYAEIVRLILVQDSKVTSELNSPKRQFGMSGGMKLKGKLFAFLGRGRLIIKLPKDRVDSLVSAGYGERCEMGKGRLMKEWIAVDEKSYEEWLSLALEAKEFLFGQLSK